MRTQIGGPTVVLKPELAQSMAVTLHGWRPMPQSMVPYLWPTGQVRVE
jgi:hypothetical protein